MLMVAACGAHASRGGGAPEGRLTVVASLFPLAEVARRVGGARVTVRDLTPPGTEPRHLALTAAQAAVVARAEVVVDVGLGFQPAVEQAAARAGITASVLAAVGGTDPYVWLDPVLLTRIVTVVAATLTQADPAGRAVYQRGARDFGAALSALDISYRSSLADCRRHDVVTSYPMFGRLADRYGLAAHAVADLPPDPTVPPGRLEHLAQLIRTKGLVAVFAAPLAPLPATQALAGQSHVRTGTLDPIEGLATGRAGQVTYLSLMADNLDALRRSLACDTSS